MGKKDKKKTPEETSAKKGEIKEEDVVDILNRPSSTSGRKLAKEYRVSHVTIQKILRGERWKSIPRC